MSKPVPVVRMIIANTESKVLILRRASTAFGQGLWCLPGGKVDYGETVEQAVRKELREETSLQCESMKFLFYQDSLPTEEGKMHCINLYFECQASGELQLNEESSEHAWVSPSDLKDYRITFRNDVALVRYFDSVRERF